MKDEGVTEDQIQLIDNKLKLEVEVSRVAGAAEKEDDDEDDDYGAEEEKKDEDKQKDLTEKVRFSLEICKDSQDENK